MMPLDRRKPACGFQSESDGRSVLQPGTASDKSRFVGFDEFYERARNFGEPIADFLESFAKLKDETGVDRILTRGAIVNERGGLLVALGHERSELLGHRNRDVACQRAFASQFFNRKQIRIALRLDRCGGFFGRDAGASERSCQRGFEIQHRLQAAVAGKNLEHIVGREQRTEQVDGVCCGHLSAGIISREMPLGGEKRGGRQMAKRSILLRLENA